MRLPSTFTADLELDGYRYAITYEYEPAERDIGLPGGWAPNRFVSPLGVEVDEDEIAARHELSLDTLNDMLCELATENEPTPDYDGEPDLDLDAGFDPYVGGYSDDC